MVDVEQKYKIKTYIKEIENYIDDNNLSQEQLRMLNIILFKLKNFDSIIENIDEDMLSGVIDNDYSNFVNNCNYVTSGNNNYISHVLSNVDSLLTKSYNYIDFSMLLNDKSGIKGYIRSYKYEITKQSKILEDEAKEILDVMVINKEKLENENSELNLKMQKFSDSINVLNENYKVLNTNVDNSLEEINNKVDLLIEEEKSKLEQAYGLKKKELEDNFSELSTNYKIEFDELLKELNQKDDKISELIGIVGGKARIGEYKNNADSSRKERILWQKITVFLFIVAFIIMLIVTLTTKDYNSFTIVKYIISALLMGAATYTGKQASNSRKDEVYYRKQELELASIDIYLENLQPEKKEDIKKELAMKIFGQAQSTYTNKYDDKKGIGIDEIVKIIESIKGIK